jgi:hypothetical protein
MLPRRIQAAAAAAAPGPPAACSNERILQLVFKNKLSQTLFTGAKVEAEDGTPIQVQLLDAQTRELVSSGPEATARLEIVALDGDFAAAATSSSETAAAADEEGKLKTFYWEQSVFEHYTLKEREGKRPLLTGDLFVCLKGGEASLGEFQFTDNSSWIRSRKFCLGIKVAPGYCQGIRIREAKTDRFIVKDHRGECKCVRLWFFTGFCLFVCFFLSSFFLSFSDRKQIQSQLGQGCSMDSLRERKAISVTTWTRVLHGLLLAGNERRRLSCEHEILIVGFVCLFVCCVWGHEQHTRSTILLHWRMRFGGWKKSVKMVLSTNV